MDLHLQEGQAAGVPNRRNGKSSKRVKSSAGEFVLDTPRDRNSEFEPLAVPKRQVVLTEQLDRTAEAAVDHFYVRPGDELLGHQ
ncbi:hypothetical protein GCM10028803_46360 [Larkinella knui]|uniref:transposase n=1 Tax=Larkinella knui TaxID=2025310 RepID=UPI001C88F6C1|nr:transposase [Larkinella knui]